MIRDCEQGVAPGLCGDGHRDFDLHVLDWMDVDHATGTWYTTRADCFLTIKPEDTFPLPLTNGELNGVKWMVNATGKVCMGGGPGTNDGAMCRRDADCTRPGVCTGVCIKGANAGAACTQNADCDSQVCSSLYTFSKDAFGRATINLSVAPPGSCQNHPADTSFTWRRHTPVEGTVTSSDAIRNGLFGKTGPHSAFNAFVVADVVVNGAVGDWAVEFFQWVPEAPCTACLYRWLHAPLNGFFTKRQSNASNGAETREAICDFINGTFNLNLGYKCLAQVQYTNTGMVCSKSQQPCTMDLDCAPIDTNGDCISTKLCMGGRICYTR